MWSLSKRALRPTIKPRAHDLLDQLDESLDLCRGRLSTLSGPYPDVLVPAEADQDGYLHKDEALCAYRDELTEAVEELRLAIQEIGEADETLPEDDPRADCERLCAELSQFRARVREDDIDHAPGHVDSMRALVSRLRERLGRRVQQDWPWRLQAAALTGGLKKAYALLEAAYPGWVSESDLLKEAGWRSTQPSNVANKLRKKGIPVFSAREARKRGIEGAEEAKGYRLLAEHEAGENPRSPGS